MHNQNVRMILFYYYVTVNKDTLNNIFKITSFNMLVHVEQIKIKKRNKENVIVGCKIDLIFTITLYSKFVQHHYINQLCSQKHKDS